MSRPTASLLTVVLVFSALVTMPACGGGPLVDGMPADDHTLVMYGSERCGICQRFRRNLSRDRIDYVFVDVTRDAEGRSAMWQYIRRARPDAPGIRYQLSLNHTVIVLGERILVSPNYAQFKKFYAAR